MEEEEEAQKQAKLPIFLQWLQVNGAELRGCNIKSCGSNKGFGVFCSDKSIEQQRVVFVVPLDLAITPMRVLEDPTLGPKCRAMFEEGDVDDRLLMMLFLAVERVRKNSSWKPYLDMLPTTFGNPLWFTDDELSELKGTTLYRATKLQKKGLQALFDDKVKHLVTELLHLDGELERVLCFEDFLWANSIFWTRALSIPFPHSYVFPQVVGEQENLSLSRNGDPLDQVSGELLSNGEDEKGRQSFVEERRAAVANSTSTHEDTVWVEGLVPGIDFCNHDLKAAATWEVDGTGSATGVSSSMYLLSAEQSILQADSEICISYGNKGNEELLYLYGFVINNNPDDYLMVHYPIEALQNVPFADSKARLLELQKVEMRCLLPKSLLDHGFFSVSPQQDCEHNKSSESSVGHFCNYSWSGQRKAPSYLNKLVFPENFLTALRTIAMQEHELLQVSSMLGELVESREDEQPSDTEVQAAVWEACGDAGALQLLVDLLSMKMMELEEGSGTEASDTELLEKAIVMEISECPSKNTDASGKECLSRNKWSCIVYRRGQKLLTHLFLKEAEHALQLSLSEEL
ncbi:hypothetical protein MRB53_003166 [Persea americana]|uniref:Uncharacterized protein n=1 Tax=Persea americana TaxID=3435 RepID=A0ACC2MXH9_PERAE|nr:hypothetical protein MRB53_003166 [Persea americana]